MAVRGYMTASLSPRKSSSKKPGSNLVRTRHDATHLRTEISFSKGYDPNNVSIAKQMALFLDPDFGLLASSAKTRTTPSSVPGGGVVRTESEINVALCVAGGRDA